MQPKRQKEKGEKNFNNMAKKNGATILLHEKQGRDYINNLTT